MIHPNMATMIGVITTDANISRELLDKALKDVISHTFNRVSVDGDTSVCDMVVILANGKANNENMSRRILTIPLSNPPLNTSVHTFPK